MIVDGPAPWCGLIGALLGLLGENVETRWRASLSFGRFPRLDVSESELEDDSAVERRRAAREAAVVARPDSSTRSNSVVSSTTSGSNAIVEACTLV